MSYKANGGILLKSFPQEHDVYLDMALRMIEVIRNNEALRKNTVMIVPVGPTGQYPIFASLVNSLRISLQNVYFFNMDEYLITPTQTIEATHPMSFHRRMKTDLYDLLDPNLSIPEDHRYFPEPGRESEYDEKIAELGEADLCLGGLGINGHIAFNEPPESELAVTVDTYALLPTRVLPISRETRTVNAIGYQRGDILGMPEYCITIGMKQILASHSIYIALNREWQHGIARHVLFDEVQTARPASLLQHHGNVIFAATDSIARGLFA